MTPTLTDALHYAQGLSWPVFPVGADCRRPLVKSDEPRMGGVMMASTDPEVLARFWRRPANIALSCGERSGVMVLDVDVKDADGLTTLADLEEQNGWLPETWESKTPSGGRHLFFQHPAKPVNNRVGFAAGLDVRTTGGSVCLPPSAKPSGKYEWVRAPGSCELAQVPEWLLSLIAPPAPPRRTFTPFSDTGPKSQRYAEAALASECRELSGMAPNTGRNQRLFQAAGRLGELAGGGLISSDRVGAALENAAMDCGLHMDDGGLHGVRATISSGLRRGLSNPRGPSRSDISPQLRQLLSNRR